MSATTSVIVSEQCLIFSLPNLSQYHRALFKVTVSFDQTQNFMTAAEPPGLHSLATWWSLLRQNSFRYCETQFLQWRHRLSLLASRWLTPTTLLSSNIAFLMQTNTDASAMRTIMTGSREWQLTMGEGIKAAQGVSFLEPELGQLGLTRTYVCTGRNLYQVHLLLQNCFQPADIKMLSDLLNILSVFWR